jgi:hypothetical protein
VVSTEILSHDLNPFFKYFSIIYLFFLIINIFTVLFIKGHISSLDTIIFKALEFILLNFINFFHLIESIINNILNKKKIYSRTIKEAIIFIFNINNIILINT